jgi:hypothetical protein
MTVGSSRRCCGVGALCLIQFAQQRDLITHFATLERGGSSGCRGIPAASLLMAVNTAFVASSELIERVAHRYGFQWIIATNRNNSLYCIHVMDGVLFSILFSSPAAARRC